MRASALFAICAAALPAQAAPDEAPDPVPLLQQYIRLDTSNPPGREALAASFFRDLLAAHGIAATIIPVGGPDSGRANVLARLASTGQRAARSALLLFNHMDVVAADPSRWKAAPFGGELRDGHVYGRGALDMKTTGLLQALALIRLKREAVPLARDVIFLGTADEEDGNIGMLWMMEHHSELLEGVELALTEGDNIELAPSQAGPVVRAWGVDVGEKMAAWLKLTAYGVAGHASVPTGDDNPVVRLVHALDRISRHETPIKVLPVVQEYYSALAGSFSDLPAGKLRSLAASLREDAVFREAFLKDAGRAASVRNTISITVLHGGPQTNVIPSTATAHLDCRLLPGEDPAAFIGEIRRLVNDPNITVEPLGDHGRPATTSGTQTALFRAIQETAARFDPGAPVVPTVLTSWTESSLLRPLGIHSYGFEPYALDDREVSLSHGDDERVSVENIRRGFEILYAVVRHAATSR